MLVPSKCANLVPKGNTKTHTPWTAASAFKCCGMNVFKEIKAIVPMHMCSHARTHACMHACMRAKRSKIDEPES